MLRSFVSSLPLGLIIFSQWGIGLLHAWMNMNAELLQFGDRKFYEVRHDMILVFNNDVNLLYNT